MFLEDFEGRVLPFDMDAAIAYADIFAARRRAGRPTATIDLTIASVARSHNASVVTRDISGFEGCASRSLIRGMRRDDRAHHMPFPAVLPDRMIQRQAGAAGIFGLTNTFAHALV